MEYGLCYPCNGLISSSYVARWARHARLVHGRVLCLERRERVVVGVPTSRFGACTTAVLRHLWRVHFRGILSGESMRPCEPKADRPMFLYTCAMLSCRGSLTLCSRVVPVTRRQEPAFWSLRFSRELIGKFREVVCPAEGRGGRCFSSRMIFECCSVSASSGLSLLVLGWVFCFDLKRTNPN